MQAPIVASNLPAAYCYPSSAQQFLSDIASLMYADVPDHITGVVFGPTDPGADFPLWYSTVHSLIFEFRSGIRVSRYWCEADPDIKMITEKTVAGIVAWDNPGLLAIPVVGAEDHTGPFWEIDHNYDGRFVIGPGLLPVLATTLAVGDTGGLDAAIQAEGEVGKHRHQITIGPEAATDSYLPAEAHEPGGFRVKGGAEALTFEITGNTVVGQTRQNGGAVAVTPMSRMPPYRAAYVVKRTGRIWRTP